MRDLHEERARHPSDALQISDEPGGRAARSRDWIFAVEDSDALDIQGIALLMTARELAVDENREVWLAGLPAEFWSLMTAIGLEGYFIPFPDHPATLA